MTKRLTTNLRFGWTTGTCATAAVNAAYMAMVTGAFPDRVSVVTPGGKEADLEVAFTDQGQDWVKAGIIKDAGDDPDVTHGAMIIACLRQGLPQSGVTFTRGDGIGLITKPGLPIAVGEPAINPVPRQMMAEAIDQLAGGIGWPARYHHRNFGSRWGENCAENMESPAWHRRRIVDSWNHWRCAALFLLCLDSLDSSRH